MRTDQGDDVADLLGDLLTADADTAGRAAAALSAARPGDPDAAVAAVVVTAPAPPGGDPPTVPAGLPTGVLARAGDGIVDLVVPVGARGAGAAEAVGRLVVDLIRREAPDGAAGDVLAGVGDPREGLLDIRASRREALVAVRAASALPALRPVARWSGLGVHRLLGCAEGPLREALVDPAVGRLLATGRDDLVRTVAVWLDAGCSPRPVTERLGIHRQTLYQRLARVEGITGLDLATGPDRLRLHLALTLLPALGTEPGHRPPARQA